MQLDGLNDISSIILNFVTRDVKTAVICERVCKTWKIMLEHNQLYQDERDIYLLGKKIAGFTLIPKKIEEVLGGARKIYNYPQVAMEEGRRTAMNPYHLNHPISRSRKEDSECPTFYIGISMDRVQGEDSQYINYVFEELNSNPFIHSEITSASCALNLFKLNDDTQDFGGALSCYQGRTDDETFGTEYGITEKQLSNIKTLLEQKHLGKYHLEH